MEIRQPIVTIAGHVDHGKTSILDKLRESSVAEKEAGSITQKISFTQFPLDALKRACPQIKKNKIPVEIPGFLFIDTPGHAAFNNLRKRGGSLADLAILVIDLNEGIKPQTAEVIQILKANKTPFIIALNKLDRLRGWNKLSDEVMESLEMQPAHVREEFDEKYYTLIGALSSHGFEADFFSKIQDFTKQIAMVPCSAKTGEGISELVMVLCGISQKFLKEKLTLGESARGVILEIKKNKAVNYLESIIYNGTLKVNDKIAIASFDEPVLTRVKSIQEIQPLSSKFLAVNSVRAASGILLQISDKTEKILPGMPFIVYSDSAKAKQEFKEQIGEKIKTGKKGIIIKADSLGSLEALITLLKENNIQFVKAGIGPINKHDISAAQANTKIDPIDAIVLGFNVEINEEIKEFKEVKVLTDEVVYKLIENVQVWREEKTKEIERERLLGLAKISKVEILHQHVFRNSNPAIFGVAIKAGKLVQGQELIDEENETTGRVKKIQSENKSVNVAESGLEVAISIPGTTFDRKLKDKQFLYSNISEKQFKKFKENKDLLSRDEISVLQEIKKIKQLKTDGWGG
ncbi:MAG: translation initiation factor IF-2 [Nanoarchaeota archaeon]|nr:translation initiation factor IF-2 [Nanoarchaeota archaeon]